MKCVGPCQLDLPENDFAWRKLGITRQNRCRKCQKEYNAAHYQANKTKIGIRIRKRAKQTSSQYVELYAEYLKDHPCIDCGEDDIRRIEQMPDQMRKLPPPQNGERTELA